MSEPARGGDVHEGPLARVPVQRKGLFVPGYEHHVGVAVVVDIAEVCAHAGDVAGVLRKGHAGLKGHLLELALAQVATEKRE
ncbi:MAG: hypothetical protein OEV33_05750 [Armatimonadota bacterium]|nr:hypothetical protein [Armatimonadota bacterium]